MFFTRAGGGRLEAGIVTILTFVFFLVSSLVIPYVPTVLASTLVLFLGIELTLEAVWESAKTHHFTEWLVVMTTLIACTFLGYAVGFGVGIGAATVIYLFWGFRDTVRLPISLSTARRLLTKVAESSSDRSGPRRRLFRVFTTLPTLK